MLLWLGACGKDSSTGSGPDKKTGDTITATLTGGAKMEMVWIEPGTFMMGSPESEPGRDNDEVQHQVTISKGFYLGKYEITREQWTAVMRATPWSLDRNTRANQNSLAVYISWDDVQIFVAKLNEVAGASLYRLPSESEWEYACRAGITTAWSFGDDPSQLGDYAWYADNASNALEEYAAVGTKKANPWGLFDMHGNVYEWCQDWYGDYPSSARMGPTGPATGSNRVYRGGYFGSDARGVRSADRYRYTPGLRSDFIGARLLRIK